MNRFPVSRSVSIGFEQPVAGFQVCVHQEIIDLPGMVPPFVTASADGLHVFVMFGCVAEVMVVLVFSISGLYPAMPAIGARQRIRARHFAKLHKLVYAVSRLNLVSVSRWVRQRTKAADLRLTQVVCAFVSRLAVLTASFETVRA
jgi:hypothetical protein